MKINNEFKEAAQFLSSLRLAYGEVRLLQSGEIDFILERAKELSIPNVKEYIEHIKNNKKIINRTPKKILEVD
ncbi:MAG: hypothetical protein ACRC8M_13820 [Cetobacterium sp.]|uniref:hypothetical protein n=1 Tax=Cetobacterium sp. TaxID=2071632 RepID=UPI003F3BB8AD